jgi:hypothetical protein
MTLQTSATLGLCAQYSARGPGETGFKLREHLHSIEAQHFVALTVIPNVLDHLVSPLKRNVSVPFHLASNHKVLLSLTPKMPAHLEIPQNSTPFMAARLAMYPGTTQMAVEERQVKKCHWRGGGAERGRGGRGCG